MYYLFLSPRISVGAKFSCTKGVHLVRASLPWTRERGREERGGGGGGEMGWDGREKESSVPFTLSLSLIFSFFFFQSFHIDAQYKGNTNNK